MSDTVVTIKERLSIVDVIGAYVELKKAGTNYKGRCPFHHEKTPSFFVSPERGTFHCFGCGKGGDIFTFTEDIEGVDFKGALKTLAERAGVELVVERPEKKERRDRIYELLEEATVRYQHHLVDHTEARTYLFKRGVTPETLKLFRIGFALPAWQDMCDHLRSRGYTDAEIEAAGIGKYGEDKRRGIYDRFRGRIMFPIADTAGRIVGFSGRIFGEHDAEVAKYINSPETEVYKKSHVLFGFDKAKHAIRMEGCTILVEGQMDLILSHQAGLTHTVALSGTALSSDHANMIGRMGETLVLALDGDTAGVTAAERSARIAIGAGMDVRIVLVPEDKDPADMVLADADKWREQVKNAEHIVIGLLSSIVEHETDIRRFRSEVSRRVVPLLSLIRNAIDREHFMGIVAERLGVSIDAVREDMEHIDFASISEGREPLIPDTRPIPTALLSGRLRDLREKRLVGLLYWQEKSTEHAVDTSEITKQMRDVVGEDGTLFIDEYGEETKDALAFESERDVTERKVDPKKEVELQFLLWKREVLRERKRALTDLIRLRQAGGEGTLTLSSSLVDIVREIEDIDTLVGTMNFSLHYSL